MEITEVNITMRDEDKLRAFVNITFDGVFVIRGLKVIQGNRGLFVCMPSRRMEDGSHKDIAHPITNEFRQAIEERVLGDFHLMNGADGAP
jgi:stage V sporulation protein G